MIFKNDDPASANHRKQPRLHLFPGRAVIRVFPRAGGHLDIEIEKRFALVLVLLEERWRADADADDPNNGWMSRPDLVRLYKHRFKPWSFSEAAVSRYLSAVKQALPEGFALFERKRGQGARLLWRGLGVVWAPART